MAGRTATHRYRDPLDRVWLSCAARVGLSVVRSAEVYASTDGRGTLALGVPETLDPDDCLAQMIFHELCHSLVEGAESFGRPDWGLDNVTDRDVVREEACLRTQAFLAWRHGLRRVLAPTTDFRAFYDALPVDPLSPADHPAVALARRAIRRAEGPPWAPHLEAALSATAQVVRAVAPFAQGPFAEKEDLPSLFGTVEEPPPAHPVGGRVGPAAARGETCGTCAWGARTRCLQWGARARPKAPACERWEPPPDCRTCAACCREAYHSVTVGPRDPVIRRHPELVVLRDGYRELRRDLDRCAALEGLGPYSCRIYDDRPKPCRDFAVGGPHCLTARRRLGLSL